MLSWAFLLSLVVWVCLWLSFEALLLLWLRLRVSATGAVLALAAGSAFGFGAALTFGQLLGAASGGSLGALLALGGTLSSWCCCVFGTGPLLELLWFLLTLHGLFLRRHWIRWIQP